MFFHESLVDLLVEEFDGPGNIVTGIIVRVAVYVNSSIED